jgi:hypothetical protein
MQVVAVRRDVFLFVRKRLIKPGFNLLVIYSAVHIGLFAKSSGSGCR